MGIVIFYFKCISLVLWHFSIVSKIVPIKVLMCLMAKMKKKKKLFLCYLRAFTSACAKNFIYLSIKTYFFYFTYSLFKTLHIRLSILHYVTLKYLFFLNFLIISLSSHIITTIHSLRLDFSLEIHKEVIKIYM